MDFAIQVIRGFYACNALAILVFCLVFWAKRRLWQRRVRRGNCRPGFFPTYTTAGNALQNLQVIAQPRVEYVLAEIFDDEAEDDDEGGPLDPTEHLHRQLRRIRRGETLERLTALKQTEGTADQISNRSY